MDRGADRKEGRCEKWLSVSWFEVVSAFEVIQDAEWLVIVAVFPAVMLDSPLPTRRQGDIRLPSQAASDRNLRSVSRSRAVRLLALPFDKAGCLSYTWQVGVLQRLVRQLARFSRRAEDESNGFLRLAATGWALLSLLLIYCR